MIHHKHPVITIDGASGTGKGTVSQSLAKRLGWKFLDSGALYRVLALAAQKHGVDALENGNAKENEKALEVLAERLDVQFIAQENKTPQIILEGEDVTKKIRSEKIGNAASIVAALPTVRSSLLTANVRFEMRPVWWQMAVIWERWFFLMLRLKFFCLQVRKNGR